MKKLVLTILAVVITLGIIGMAGIGASYFYIRQEINTPLSSVHQDQSFIIEKGESVREISSHLEKAGLITKSLYFDFYVWQKRAERKLQAGEYLLSPSMTIPEIVEILTLGKVVSHETEVTFPEGFSIKQMDSRLASKGLIAEGELLALSHNSTTLIAQYDFFDCPAKGSYDCKTSLEGFLFPDTYRFERGTKVENIARKMLDNFGKKLDDGLRTEIRRQKKIIYEIIIMASLLEKEVRTDEDRRIVSGIFWKRLGQNYPLESCATIAYILGIDKWRYSFEDTRISSPYNTYFNAGLPPTPISNPGLSAIRAAIYPQDSDYNFFLSKPDGETVFSKTLEEHNAAKAEYLKSR